MGVNTGPLKIIIRYRDGKLLKGYTNDFFPNKPAFHVQPWDEAAGQSIAATMSELKSIVVAVGELKAVFFVKDFKGDPGYTERRFWEGDRPSGRKVEVTFYDGEVIVGTTMGYDPKRIGFFVIPADPQANNLRVFVVTEAVRQFRYL